MSLKLIELIKDDAASIDELVEKTSYSKGTIQNVFIDLSSFSLVIKTNNDKYKLNCDIDEIPGKVRTQMLGHTIYQESMSIFKTGNKSYISTDDIAQIINRAYSSEAGRAHDQYVNRIISWLRYSGLISLLHDKIRVYDANNYSPDFGEITGGRNKSSLFLAASNFENAVLLVEKLIKQGSIDQSETGARNVITDLVALGICRRVSGNKIELVKNSDPDLKIEQHLAKQVLRADTVILLDALVQKYGDDLNTLVEKMSYELDKKWKPASGQRYVRALLRYRTLAKDTMAANMGND